MKGFFNGGQTCYFNTALQLVLYIPALSNYYIRKPYSGECTFTRAYSDLVRSYWTRGYQAISAKHVLDAFIQRFPRFGDTDEQQDVQEAVLCIIDILEQATPEIKLWFYGKKKQETVWPGGRSSSEEDFLVHILTSNGKDMAGILNKSIDWNVIENFTDDDGKQHRLAASRMIFSKLPQILMISFDRKSFVEIMEQLTIDGQQYNLISTALHVGNQHDGHYVSFVKRRNKWFLINDENIEEHDLPPEGGYYFMVYKLA